MVEVLYCAKCEKRVTSVDIKNGNGLKIEETNTVYCLDCAKELKLVSKNGTVQIKPGSQKAEEEVTTEDRGFFTSRKVLVLLVLILIPVGVLGFFKYQDHVKKTALKEDLNFIKQLKEGITDNIEKKRFEIAARDWNGVMEKDIPVIKKKYPENPEVQQMIKDFRELKKVIFKGFRDKWNTRQKEVREELELFDFSGIAPEKLKLWKEIVYHRARLDEIFSIWGSRDEDMYLSVKKDEEIFISSFLKNIEELISSGKFDIADQHIKKGTEFAAHYRENYPESSKYEGALSKIRYTYYQGILSHANAVISSAEQALNNMKKPDLREISTIENSISKVESLSSEKNVDNRKELIQQASTLKKKINDLTDLMPALAKFQEALEIYRQGKVEEAKTKFEGIVKNFKGSVFAKESTQIIQSIKELKEVVGKLERAIDQRRPELVLKLSEKLKTDFHSYRLDKEYQVKKKKLLAFYEYKKEGKVFFEQQEFRKALESFKKALDIYSDDQLKDLQFKALFEVKLNNVIGMYEGRRFKQALTGLVDLSSQRDKLENPEIKRLHQIKREIKNEALKNEIIDTREKKMALIDSDSFLMGNDEALLKESRGEHRVTITKPFYMDVTEVTNREYEMFDPSHKSKRIEGFEEDDIPVTNITFQQAVDFTKWLSEREGVEYTLPTEAQWEMAAKGGQNLTYSHEKININSNGPKNTYGFEPNPYGLYHMSGNVWEMCMGEWGEYEGEEKSDPQPSLSGSFRVMRGGSFVLHPDYNNEKEKFVTTYGRNAIRKGDARMDVGFRCIRKVDPEILAKIDEIEKNLR